MPIYWTGDNNVKELTPTEKLKAIITGMVALPILWIFLVLLLSL